MKRFFTKKIVAMMLAMIMAFTLYVPAAAEEQQPTEPVTQDTITVSVKVRTTALNGGEIASNEKVTLPAGSTALDALKAVSGADTASGPDANGYYTQGILKWSSTKWGNYISAVKVDGHSNTNKFFGDNGTASTWDGASKNKYSCLDELNLLEEKLYNKANVTFNNTVNEVGYLSEKDYNNYSGWMIIINGNTNNLGCDQVLQDNDKVDLNFSMFMGLDLGQDSWVEDAAGQWIQADAWNSYVF